MSVVSTLSLACHYMLSTVAVIQCEVVRYCRAEAQGQRRCVQDFTLNCLGEGDPACTFTLEDCTPLHGRERAMGSVYRRWLRRASADVWMLVYHGGLACDADTSQVRAVAPLRHP